MNATRLARLTAAFALTALLAGACSSDGSPTTTTAPPPPPSATTAAVAIEGFLFSPADLTIEAGQDVTWTNQDRILHTVTAGVPDAPEESRFDRDLDGRDATTTIGFDEAGTFSYFCARHPHMRGTITVVDGS